VSGVEFVLVTKEAFYAVVGPLDVHPRSLPDRTLWETPGRRVIGVTTPGYAERAEATYRVLPEFAEVQS